MVLEVRRTIDIYEPRAMANQAFRRPQEVI